MYGNDDVGDDDEEEDVDDNPTLRSSSSATAPQVWTLLLFKYSSGFLDIAGRVFYCVFDSAGRSSRQAEKARREVELELEAAARKIGGL